MRLWVISDLHTDVTTWHTFPTPDHDVLVVAGDISDSVHGAGLLLYALHLRTRRPVVFVPGNHDLFDATITGFRAQLESPVYVLPAGESVVIDGVRFVGATLWTDFELFETEFASQSWAARNMPEYQRVRKADGSDRIWPIDTAAAHDRHLAEIEAVLAVPHTGPTVVVTHHAPSARSIRGHVDVEDAAFASNLEDVITRYRPQLWVHGHVHHANDYWVGGTRVVSNPRGYQGDGWAECTGWDEGLVINV